MSVCVSACTRSIYLDSSKHSYKFRQVFDWFCNSKVIEKKKYPFQNDERSVSWYDTIRLDWALWTAEATVHIQNAASCSRAKDQIRKWWTLSTIEQRKWGKTFDKKNHFTTAYCFDLVLWVLVTRKTSSYTRIFSCRYCGSLITIYP